MWGERKIIKANPIISFFLTKLYCGVVGLLNCSGLIATNALPLIHTASPTPTTSFSCVSLRCLWKAFGHFDVKKIGEKRRKKNFNVEFVLIRCEQPGRLN